MRKENGQKARAMEEQIRCELNEALSHCGIYFSHKLSFLYSRIRRQWLSGRGARAMEPLEPRRPAKMDQGNCREYRGVTSERDDIKGKMISDQKRPIRKLCFFFRSQGLRRTDATPL